MGIGLIIKKWFFLTNDVTCFGSATRDVFVQIDAGFFKKNLCFLPGSKISVLDMGFFSGGGATNTAVGFSRLGLKTGIVCSVGKDKDGQEIKKELEREKVGRANFFEEKQKRTSYSIILTGFGKDRVILNFAGATALLDENKKIHWQKAKAKWFFVSSLHGKGKMLKKIFAQAKKNKTKIAFNPGQKEIEMGFNWLKKYLGQTEILCLNAKEALSLTGKTSIKKNLALLALHAKRVVITDGKHKAFAQSGRKIFSIKPPKTKTVDSSGAGDAFNAGFVSAIIKEKDFHTALLWGAKNACSVVKFLGTKNKLLTEKEISKKTKQ